MPFTLQQLSDLEDIKLLKHRYYRGIDTADHALLATLFTDDVKVQYRGGTYRVDLSGREAMLEFLMDSFHSDAVAMHHGHMPEITFDGPDEANGIWYLEDMFIARDQGIVTAGSAIYRDRYRRIDGEWKIATTEYDRIMELVEPIRPDMRITTHFLGSAGRKPDQRGDISHLITWLSPGD